MTTICKIDKMEGIHLTTCPWPAWKPLPVAGSEELAPVPSGIEIRQLVKGQTGRVWHRPRGAGIDTDGNLVLQTTCGTTLRSPAEDLDQAEHAKRLCRSCWPDSYKPPSSRTTLGHIVEVKKVEVSQSAFVRVGPDFTSEVSAPFVISLLDVQDGVRNTYRGVIHAILPRKIAGTRDPYGDLVAFAHRVDVTAVSVEVHDPSTIAERVRAANLKAAHKLVRRLVTTGTSTTTTPPDEVIQSLGRPGTREDRERKKRRILERIAQMVKENGGKPDYERMRRDDTLLRLAGRSTPYGGHIRKLKKDAVDAGLLPRPKPRGRPGQKPRRSS